jgi:hypothetical protein
LWSITDSRSGTLLECDYKKVWSKKILSISDEVFIFLCLVNYGK